MDTRVRVLLPILAGSLLVLLAIFADPILGRPREWGAVETATLSAGLAFAIGGVSFRSGFAARMLPQFSLSVIAVFVAVGAAEMVFRVTGADLAWQERVWRRVAPYYRQPTVPIDPVFFRRDGPEEWTGQVINTQMKLYKVSPNPYVDEPVITVRYDSLGFRAAGVTDDWEIVVTGDSFTELGYLPDEQLHTTLLGDLLGVRVRNLGVSQTGPLTQLTYLENFGIAPGTKHAIIVFFEGNDLWDIVDEVDALQRWRETGEREYRAMQASSLVRALDGMWWAFRRPPIGPDASIQAYFRSVQQEVPVTLVYSPATASDVWGDDRLLRALELFFNNYGELGRRRGVTVWLAYMPAKVRALYGHLRFVDGADDRFREWTPTDLPDLIADLAARKGVTFLDLTAAIVQETAASRELLYNAIHDTHVNARGARVVAEELARRIGGAAGFLQPRVLRDGVSAAIHRAEDASFGHGVARPNDAANVSSRSHP